MHAKTVLGWCCVAMTATALACTPADDPKPDVDAGGSGGTGGTGGTGGAEPVGPTVAAQERLGHFTPGPVRAVLPMTVGNLDIVGHVGVELDPSHYGLDLPTGEDRTTVYGGGLSVLDRTTGKVRFYQKEDGLPEVTYTDSGIVFGTGTVPIFDLVWVVPDQVFAAAAMNWVVVGTIAADGSITFASTQVQAEGAADQAFVATIASVDGEIFAGTSQGLAVIDPTTLAVTRWADVGTDVASDPYIWDVTAGDLHGSTVVALVGTLEAPTRVAVITATGTESFFFESGETPTALGQMPGAILVGVREADGRGSLRAILPAIGGVGMETFLDADSLKTPENPNLIPSKIVFDAGRNQLVVGGSFVGNGPSQPIALLTLDLSVSPPKPHDLTDSRDPYYWAMPWNVDALAIDPRGSFLVAGRGLCSDIHTKQMGLYRYEFGADGSFRVVRPWVSGVRSIDVDPVEGNAWLGLSDETPGEACFGMNVQSGICRLKADGSCELWTPRTTEVPGDFTSLPPTTDLAFGDVATKRIAVGTTKAGLYLRTLDNAKVMSPALDPGSSLWMTKLAWGENGELWLGSISQWSELPGMDNDAIDTRTPHGLGYLRVTDDAVADRTSFRRYSRLQAINWGKDYDTPGMPSNTVYDVVALPGAQHALAACGVERLDRTYNHLLPDPSPKGIAGGLAEIEGTTITAFAPPDGLAFGDVVGLARAADGTYFALDAGLGILRLDLEAHTTTLFAPAVWTSPERGLSFAIDASGRLAVGTTAGLYVFGADGAPTTVFASGHGFVWSAAFVGDGVLYAGTDQGLVRVALDTATLPPAGPSGPLPRELWALPLGCNGEDGCECTDSLYCAPGLTCNCDAEWNCACGVYDPCLDNPGAEGCGCVPAQTVTAPCQDGLSCQCAGEECTCQQACDGTDGCPCGSDADCQTGYACGLDGVCSSTCSWDCTCETASGCPDGMECIQDTDWEGNPIQYCDLAADCSADCSCPTDTGCPVAMYCYQNPDGTQYCRGGL